VSMYAGLPSTRISGTGRSSGPQGRRTRLLDPTQVKLFHGSQNCVQASRHCKLQPGVAWQCRRSMLCPCPLAGLPSVRVHEDMDVLARTQVQ
jgi:hypothetical protein